VFSQFSVKNVQRAANEMYMGCRTTRTTRYVNCLVGTHGMWLTGSIAGRQNSHGNRVTARSQAETFLDYIKHIPAPATW